MAERHDFHTTRYRVGVFRGIAPYAYTCFLLTLVTDILYWQTVYLMWSHFSSWLLLSGLIFGCLALVAGLVEAALRDRHERPGWPALAGHALVLVIAFVNSLVHAGDGWTAVVPYGLVLSLVTVLVMFATAWLARPYVATEVRHA